MRPATWPRPPDEERVLWVDPLAQTLEEAPFVRLAELFGHGDVLVVNDAGTLPASLRGHFRDDAIELRIASVEPDETFLVVAFGGEDWHTPTERRPPPPSLRAGDVIAIDESLRATVLARDSRSARLYRVSFSRVGAALWQALYHVGRPIQYAHVERPLPLWHAQTRYAGRPIAVEIPSAGRPLRFSVLASLQRRRVKIVPITHAAGLSATGDTALDALLPLPERYSIPEATVRAIASAEGRVIAVGTSVVRAIEGATALGGGSLRAGDGVTDLRVGPAFRPRVITGLLTGMHPAGTSHHDLISAFAPPSLLARALDLAETHGYLGHEFGDSMLIAPAASRP